VTSPNGIRAIARVGGSDVVTKRDLWDAKEKNAARKIIVCVSKCRYWVSAAIFSNGRILLASLRKWAQPVEARYRAAGHSACVKNFTFYKTVEEDA
jgi:hypothetical protein